MFVEFYWIFDRKGFLMLKSSHEDDINIRILCDFIAKSCRFISFFIIFSIISCTF